MTGYVFWGVNASGFYLLLHSIAPRTVSFSSHGFGLIKVMSNQCGHCCSGQVGGQRYIKHNRIDWCIRRAFIVLDPGLTSHSYLYYWCPYRHSHVGMSQWFNPLTSDIWIIEWEKSTALFSPTNRDFTVTCCFYHLCILVPLSNVDQSLHWLTFDFVLFLIWHSDLSLGLDEN